MFHHDFLVPSGSGFGFRALSPPVLSFLFSGIGRPMSSLLRINVVETWFVAVWGLCWCNVFFLIFSLPRAVKLIQDELASLPRPFKIRYLAFLLSLSLIPPLWLSEAMARYAGRSASSCKSCAICLPRRSWTTGDSPRHRRCGKRGGPTPPKPSVALLLAGVHNPVPWGTGCLFSSTWSFDKEISRQLKTC